MADIISLGDKQKQVKEKEAAIIRKRKILAVQKIFQCTQCPFKCKKCGTQINPDRHLEESEDKEKRQYVFCESCTEEYIDYVERLGGGGDPECYWHNDDWLDLWEKWIEYQETVDRYLKSEEFVQLLQELKQPIYE
ncbi:MAG: hypothetical protein GY795_15245 [Desulfobacterales bacterium]|nr:hypothetical protein [Desulfobacterales bacterium]